MNNAPPPKSRDPYEIDILAAACQPIEFKDGDNKNQGKLDKKGKEGIQKGKRVALLNIKQSLHKKFKSDSDSKEYFIK